MCGRDGRDRSVDTGGRRERRRCNETGIESVHPADLLDDLCGVQTDEEETGSVCEDEFEDGVHCG